MAGGEEPAGAAAMAGLGAGLSGRDAVADRDGAGGDALDVADPPWAVPHQWPPQARLAV